MKTKYQTRLWSREVDFPVFERWWAEHEVPPCAKESLPDIGIVAVDDTGDSLAAVWMYLDNSTPVAWIGFWVTNPGVSARVAYSSTRSLLEALEEVAKSQSRVVCYALAPAESGLKKLLKRHHWHSTHPSLQFVKVIPPNPPQTPEIEGNQNG